MENKTKEQEIIVENKGPIPTVYVEGISQLMVGLPNSRVIFNKMIIQEETDTKKTERQTPTIEIVMPTVNLINMCTSILNQVKSVADPLKAHNAYMMNELNRQIEQLTGVSQNLPEN